MKELFIQYKGILKDLLRYGVLKTEALEHPGLYNGKLGMTILFYEYSRYSGDALYEQFADEILESIMELPDDLSLDLSDGLCGIGCHPIQPGYFIIHYKEFQMATGKGQEKQGLSGRSLLKAGYHLAVLIFPHF